MGYKWPTIKLVDGELVWVTYIKRQVYNRNNCINGVFTGGPGSGKSWTMLSLAEQLDPDFELDGNWYFDAEELFKDLKEYYTSTTNKPKKGKQWWFDEAGIDLNNLSYFDEINRGFNAFFQTCRHRNYIFGCSVPYLNFISKGVRTLLNVHFKSDGYTKDNMTINYPRQMEYSGDMQKFYKKRLFVLSDFPDYCNKLLTPKPSNRLVNEYEKLKKQFTGDLLGDVALKISAFKKKQGEKAKGFGQLTEAQEGVLDVLKKGMSMAEATKQLGVTKGCIYDSIRRIKNKGIIITARHGNNNEVLKYEVIDNREVKKD